MGCSKSKARGPHGPAQQRKPSFAAVGSAGDEAPAPSPKAVPASRVRIMEAEQPVPRFRPDNKLLGLPQDKQAEVMQFVESLASRTGGPSIQSPDRPGSSSSQPVTESPPPLST
eukprot:Sspe_Gene.110575::Locus_91637_Transcript_4_7_Confidence_0.474_Length_513::g.110575::m.110575